MVHASGMGSKGQEFTRLVKARDVMGHKILHRRTRAADTFCVTRAQYWMLNAASLAVAALIGFEIHSVHQMDDVTALVQQAQAPLIEAQQQGPQIQRLVQRIAVGSTRDPALKDLLAKYGISLTVKRAPGAEAASVANASAPPVPTSPDAPVSTSAAASPTPP
jgi:hypothetical protein